MKVIDLLNKIANGEEVPLIKYRNKILHWNKEKYRFEDKDSMNTLYEMDIKNDKLNEYETSLLIEPLYRGNKKELVVYVDNKKMLESSDEIDLCIELDILYDLIKVDMVEKVEE